MQNELRNDTAEPQQHEHESALESDGLQWHSNALYQPDDDPLSHARRASAQLKPSKKGGLFHSNSDKYKAVDKGLDDILKLLVTAFSGDNDSDRKTQQRLQLAYGTLIDSCQRYNTSISFFTKKKTRRQAQTENGRERQGIVDSIEEMAKKDLAALMLNFDKMPGLPPQERAKSVQEALRIARTTSLTLKGNWEDQKHYGGVISDLIRVDTGGFEGTGNRAFSKNPIIMSAIPSSPRSKKHWKPSPSSMKKSRSPKKITISSSTASRSFPTIPSSRFSPAPES